MKSSHQLSGNTSRLDREDNCYALTLAKRLKVKAMGNPKYQVDGDPRTSGPGFGVTVRPSRNNGTVQRRVAAGDLEWVLRGWLTSGR
jgi:protein gp37